MWPLGGESGEMWKLVVSFIVALAAAVFVFLNIRDVLGAAAALLVFIAAYALMVRIVEFL
ncbi:MAG: hypothetical protein HYY37_00975 [Candidatus Aenigmarchaeota archaeon]|nr:hypothetical protein [Candidatus Aenigmarchaeota archaeon]